MVLNNRKLFVLSLISKAYLKTGEPIGSKQIALELGGEVSSATIRNDMAQLEQEGLLFQPHTSAGRIPTAAGMRLYIDKLMEKRTISKQPIPDSTAMTIDLCHKVSIGFASVMVGLAYAEHIQIRAVNTQYFHSISSNRVAKI